MKQGIVFLGLAKDKTDLLELATLRAQGYEIWTLNDFWTSYPLLEPDVAYNIHLPEECVEHVDDQGITRWGGDWRQQYKDKVRHLEVTIESLEELEGYYADLPEEWFTSTMNYMFCDFWRDYAHRCSHIVIRGMKLSTSGERRGQLKTLVSAINMHVRKGGTIDCPMYETWVEWLQIADFWDIPWQQGGDTGVTYPHNPDYQQVSQDALTKAINDVRKENQ